MSNLNVEQTQQLNLYLKKNPKVSREKAIQLLFGKKKNTSSVTGKGVTLEHNTQNAPKPQTIYLQSGRKVVYTRLKDGRLACKYYGADGTAIKPDYFKKVEGNISISTDNTSYTLTKNGKRSKAIKAKNPRLGVLDQNIVKLNNEEKRLNKIKNQQGFIGNGWDWIKNKTGLGDGSDKAQKQLDSERQMLTQMRNPNAKIDASQFEKITGQKCTKANLEKFKQGELSQTSEKINGYQEGQEMAVDIVADTVSGIAAIPVYGAAVAAAPFTGGTSIAIGIAAAGATGALLKVGIKAADAASGGRQYTLNDAGHDAATGTFSGILAPVTGGMGGAIGKTVATKVGLQTVKTVGKEIVEEAAETGVKQGIKTALTNPTGYEYVGNNVGKKILAYGAEMLTDGAVSGAADNAFRTAIDGGSLSDIGKAALEGGVGGAIMSPIIGGGMKVSGKITSKILENNKVYDFVNTPAENREALLKQFAKDSGISEEKFNEYGFQFNEGLEIFSPTINTPQKVKLLNELINNKERKYSLDTISNIFQCSGLEKHIDTMDLAKLFNSKNKNGEYIFNSKLLTDNYLDSELLNTIKTNPDIINKSFMDFYTYLHTKPEYEDLAKELLKNVKTRNKSESIEIYTKNRIKEFYTPYLNAIKGINEIEDKTLANMVKEEFEKLNLKEMNVKNIDHNIKKLEEVVNIYDIYNNLTNKYTTLTSIDGRTANFRKYIDCLKGKKDDYIELQNETSLHYDQEDILKNAQIGFFVDYCKENNNKISNYLYENYYLKPLGNTHLKEISDKYGTKIFLSEHWRQDPDAVTKIEKELEVWTKISRGKAKMPPVIDLTSVKEEYINSATCYGDGVAAGFSEMCASGAISINGDGVLAPTTIRHEMTHSNDLKRIEDFPSDFIDATTKQKAAKGDIKAKYWDEFKNAGIPEEHIPYAYNNPLEFIAVASEGDMSKYSDEFKKVLIRFGMPKWELNFPKIEEMK